MATGGIGFSNQDVWTLDIERGVPSRLTFDPAPQSSPIWSPDGSHVAYLSTRANSGLYQKLASGASEEVLLLKGGGALDTTQAFEVPDAWSPDGRSIAYETTVTNGSRGDIWILPLSGDRKPYPFVQGPGIDTAAAFSPDGRWVAYSSDESGVPQVYVQRFPKAPGQYQVSRSGGSQPLWRADGRELFFLDNSGAVMAVSVRASSDRLDADIPIELFKTRVASTGRRQYAVTKDGQRFLLIVPQEGDQNTPPQQLTVMVNWLASVQR
jgi:Tol biopolymer transport system component